MDMDRYGTRQPQLYMPTDGIIPELHLFMKEIIMIQKRKPWQPKQILKVT